MDEIEVLSGSALSEKIRHVCTGKKVDCAVAFWGAGIPKALFGEKSLSHVRIICDISMGCTTQAALSELGAWKSKKLTVRRGLHAKLFLSELGAVIGSANASNNGVGLKTGSGGRLFEMGVFCPPSSDAYQQAKSEFGAIWDPTQWVTKAIWQQAERQSREPGEPFVKEGSRGGLLIERLRENEARLGTLSVILTQGDINNDEEKVVKKAIKDSLPPNTIDNEWETLSYNKRDVPQKTAVNEALSFHINDNKRLVVEGYSHCLIPRSAIFHLVVGRKNNAYVAGHLGIRRIGKQALTKLEQERIREIIVNEDHAAVQTVGGFLRLLDVSNTPR